MTDAEMAEYDELEYQKALIDEALATPQSAIEFLRALEAEGLVKRGEQE